MKRGKKKIENFAKEPNNKHQRDTYTVSYLIFYPSNFPSSLLPFMSSIRSSFVPYIFCAQHTNVRTYICIPYHKCIPIFELFVYVSYLVDASFSSLHLFHRTRQFDLITFESQCNLYTHGMSYTLA